MAKRRTSGESVDATVPQQRSEASDAAVLHRSAEVEEYRPATESDALDESDRAELDARERIASRAYEIYLERGATHGRDLDDWLEAERQMSLASSDRPNDE